MGGQAPGLEWLRATWNHQRAESRRSLIADKIARPAQDSAPRKQSASVQQKLLAASEVQFCRRSDDPERRARLRESRLLSLEGMDRPPFPARPRSEKASHARQQRRSNGLPQ